MVCTNPMHEQCSREMALNVISQWSDDPETDVRRILKAWVLLGARQEDKSAHMHRSWKAKLLQLFTSGAILPEPELDRRAVTSAAEWPKAQSPLVASN